jgi:hypothetical protein
VEKICGGYVMGIFESKQERRFRREVEIRRGISAIKRNIKDLERHEREWKEKAIRAKRLADEGQYQFIKKTLKKTIAQRKLRERQLLSLETALQIKNQAEADVNFAKSMAELSKVVSELYAGANIPQVQKQFEKAITQADTLRQQTEIFLDMATESMLSSQVEGEEDIVSDTDIDRMIEAEAMATETDEIDKEIEKGIEDIEKQIEKE